MRPPRPVLLIIIALAAAALLPAPSRGQAPAPPSPPAPIAAPVPTQTILGFSTDRAPGNVLACRQAFAYAVDREAVAKAVAPHLSRPAHPARGLQHPALPRVNPTPYSYAYDPARAKELYAECGFAGTIRILAGGSATRAIAAHDEAVAESLRRTLSARVEMDRLGTAELLLFTARTGSAAVWMLPWVSDPRQFGYPSFALGIGAALVTDAEVRTLVGRGDAPRAEELILRRALVIPIIYY